MYQAVKGSLRQPGYALLYLIALFLLGFHLRHGFEFASRHWACARTGRHCSNGLLSSSGCWCLSLCYHADLLLLVEFHGGQ